MLVWYHHQGNSTDASDITRPMHAEAALRCGYPAEGIALNLRAREPKLHAPADVALLATPIGTLYF